MPLWEIAVLLATGLGIGFLSGMLGIGGGILLTPIQYWLYTSVGISSDLAIKISFATTLAVVFPTAASGVIQHQRHNCINWRAAIIMGIVTAGCSFAGATLAAGISGSALKLGFGILALIIAVRMLTVRISDAQRPVRNNLWLWCALAVPIGFITGILGIGGGIIVVPVLVLVLRFRMRDAAATSLAMMLFTSAGGMAGYIVNGTRAAGLPEYTFGYIYWPAWIALSVTSILTAQFGAMMAHRISGKWLNYIFTAVIIYVALNMLGAIDWIAHFF